MNNKDDQPPKKHNLTGIILIGIMLVMLVAVLAVNIIDAFRSLIAFLKKFMNNSKEQNLDLLKVYGVIIAVSAVVYFVLRFLQKRGVIPKNETKMQMIKASVITGGMICALALMAFFVYDAVKG